MISTLLFLFACSSYNKDTATFCDHDPPLTYANFGKGYIDKHCVGCHSSLIPVDTRVGAPIGVDLNTYQDVLMWAERIGARSTGDYPTMPPGGGPSADEIALLEEWLECDIYPTVAKEVQ